MENKINLAVSLLKTMKSIEKSLVSLKQHNEPTGILIDDDKLYSAYDAVIYTFFELFDVKCTSGRYIRTVMEYVEVSMDKDDELLFIKSFQTKIK